MVKFIHERPVNYGWARCSDGLVHFISHTLPETEYSVCGRRCDYPAYLGCGGVSRVPADDFCVACKEMAEKSLCEGEAEDVE